MKNAKVLAMVFAFAFTVATVFATTVQDAYTYVYKIIGTECEPIECVIETLPIECPIEAPYYVDALCTTETPVAFLPL